MTEEHKKIVTNNLGKYSLGLASGFEGKKHKKETITKLIIAGKKRTGINSGNWKGGISSNKEYRNWQKNERNRVVKLLKHDGSSHTFEQWNDIKNQCDFKCLSCKKQEPEIKLTIDHIVPLSKGGSDSIDNIQPLCMSCNNKKFTKIIKYRVQ